MDEETKVKVTNLISLRQSLLNLLPILVGGTVGMAFVNDHIILRNILITTGSFFIAIIAKSLFDTITEINQTVYCKGDKKWKKL